MKVLWHTRVHRALTAAVVVVGALAVSGAVSGANAPVPVPQAASEASVARSGAFLAEPVAHPRAIVAHPVAPAVKKVVTPRQVAAPKPRPKPKPKPVARYHPVVRGVLPSAYRGSWYDPRFEGTRMCIVQRESHGVYSVVNSQGYQGAYQFGLAWTRTIQGWAGEHVPIRYMSRYAQDYAFWRAFDHGKGRMNWNYPNHQCW